nr:hypothetical protein [Abalone asfa-like virus]
MELFKPEEFPNELFSTISFIAKNKILDAIWDVQTRDPEILINIAKCMINLFSISTDLAIDFLREQKIVIYSNLLDDVKGYNWAYLRPWLRFDDQIEIDLLLKNEINEKIKYDNY